VVETRSVTVSAAENPGAAAPSRREAAPPEAVTIDLRESRPSPGLPRFPRPPSRHTFSAGGYASFTGPPGLANRAVVRRVDASGEQHDVEFDSAELAPEDLFALTLLRPGTYAMRNVLGDHSGRIVVTYPVLSDTRYRPGDPVEVRAGEAGFDPESLEVGPGQGIVFRLGTRSRITVDLVDPDDGPGDGELVRRPRAGWRAPRRPEGASDDARDGG